MSRSLSRRTAGYRRRSHRKSNRRRLEQDSRIVADTPGEVGTGFFWRALRVSPATPRGERRYICCAAFGVFQGSPPLIREVTRMDRHAQPMKRSRWPKSAPTAARALSDPGANTS
jgi:hypothetical protein